GSVDVYTHIRFVDHDAYVEPVVHRFGHRMHVVFVRAREIPPQGGPVVCGHGDILHGMIAALWVREIEGTEIDGVVGPFAVAVEGHSHKTLAGQVAPADVQL